jgi:hypothetical protein
MPLAVLIEDLQSNPTVLLNNEPILFPTDDNLAEQLYAAIGLFNVDKVVSKAGGALVWYDDKPNQTFEYFPKEGAIRPRSFGHTAQLSS